MNKLEKIKGLTGVLFLFVLAFLAGRFLAKAVDTRSTMAPAVLPAEGNWGLSFQEDGKPPVANATYEELAKYDAFYAENTQDKVLYLTFDCGYENGNTPAILDALKKHNVKATFFVVGNYLETSPDLVKRMLEEGHIVGNHSYHHPDMSRMDKESFARELGDLETLYQQITGTPMVKFYRPPQGKYSENNLQIAKDLGYKTFFGAWPMWTGIRISSRPMKRPLTNCSKGCIRAPLYCFIIPRKQMGRFLTSCSQNGKGWYIPSVL